MKTNQEYLREAFGEAEIAKEISKYPSSIQRPAIYRAMDAAIKDAYQEGIEKGKTIDRDLELFKKHMDNPKPHDGTIEECNAFTKF